MSSRRRGLGRNWSFHTHVDWSRTSAPDSNALATIEEELKIQPNNPSTLVNKGYVCIQLNEFDQAIARSADTLARLSAEVLAEHRAGQTEELDPERL